MNHISSVDRGCFSPSTFKDVLLNSRHTPDIPTPLTLLIVPTSQFTADEGGRLPLLASVYLSAPLSVADLVGAITFMVKRAEVSDWTHVYRRRTAVLVVCGGMGHDSTAL